MATITSLAELELAGKLEIGQMLTMLGCNLQVMQPNLADSYYSIHTNRGYNLKLFDLLGIGRDAQDITRILVKEDYTPNGNFPRCDTLEALYKLIELLYQCEYIKNYRSEVWNEAIGYLPGSPLDFINIIQSNSIKPLNTSNHGEQIQISPKEGAIIVSRVTPAISRGSEIRGNRVSGKLSKATTRIGHLGYHQVTSECIIGAEEWEDEIPF
jgi:hypothetical protein